MSDTPSPTKSRPRQSVWYVHPGVRLQGQGRQRLKVPCFFYRPNQLILPAFGVFTGLHIMQPSTEDQVYALGEKHVLAISIRKK